jgi:hypothetical protein
LDPEQYAFALSAIRESRELLGMMASKHVPFVDMTPDGVAFLKWNSQNSDAVVLLGGDGTVSLSVALKGESFVRNAKDYPLNNHTAELISDSLRAMFG